MSITRLNAALEGRYRIESELGEGGFTIRTYIRGLLPLVLVSLAGCGTSDLPTETTDPPSPVATTVTISPPTLSFSSFGETQGLVVVVADQNGATMGGASVTWSSSASAVASVSSTGLVTAVADGQATITAASGSASGTTSTTVLQIAASITLTPSSVVLSGPGDTATVTATVMDAGGSEIVSPSLEWSSEDEAIVTVSSVGVVTAVSSGSATLTVEVTSGDGQALTQALSITVEAGPPTVVEAVEGDGQSGAVGSVLTDPLRARVTDEFGNRLEGVRVDWSTTGVGSLTPNPGITNRDGVVTASWKLDIIPGTQTATGAVAGVPPVAFEATATPVTGLYVTVSAPESSREFVIAIDHGPFANTPRVVIDAGQVRTEAEAVLSIPAGAGYRVRIASSDPKSSDLVSFSGKAEGVAVTTGMLTPVHVDLSAPNVEIEAPDTVGGGSTVTVTWTYDDPGSVLDESGAIGAAGFLRYSTSRFSDGFGSSEVSTGTKLSETRFRFSAQFSAPPTPGKVYFQVSGITILNLFDVPGVRTAFYYGPSTARGEPLREIVIN